MSERERASGMGIRALYCVFFLVNGCAWASRPLTPHCTATEEGACAPTKGYRPDGALAHIKDSTLVLISMSGGGTRAAAFSEGVLVGMDSIAVCDSCTGSLLDHSTIVSGVSGGAFTAAHFALFGKAGFEAFKRDFLDINCLFDRTMLRYLLWPPQPWKWFSPKYSRTEYFAEQWNRRLFHDSTFAALERRKDAPFLVISATRLSPYMGAFPFVQEAFSAFCGDLSGVTIGRAVTASAAFPGVFSAMTFEGGRSDTTHACARGRLAAAGASHVRRHGDSHWPDEYLSTKIDSAALGNPYSQLWEYDERMERGANVTGDHLHLVDGGLADNLGWRILLSGLLGNSALLPLGNTPRRYNSIVWVIVDAGTPGGNVSQSAITPKIDKVIEDVAGYHMDELQNGAAPMFKTFLLPILAKNAMLAL